jgi:hypothetical protein
MLKRTIVALVVLVGAVGGVAAQAETTYTPPGDRSIDALVEGYNANVEQVPGWLEAAVNADVVYVTVYPDGQAPPGDLFAVESTSTSPTIYRFEMQSDATVERYEQVESVERGGGTYVIATDASTMDAVVTAEDPVAVGTAAFSDGALQLQASGPVRNMVIRVVRMASQIRGMFG